MARKSTKPDNQAETKRNKGGRPCKYSTPDELNHYIDLYFTNCTCNDIAPKWHDLLLYLDVSDDTLLRYRSNEDNKYSGYADVIKKAERLLSCFWQQYALDHPNLQSYCMFQLKQPHNGGFTDRPVESNKDININVKINGESSGYFD